MTKSIRQFAEELNVSHTAIRKVISQLETELGQTIGLDQGKGKPTLLNEDEQQLIRSRVNPFHPTSNQVSLVPYEPSKLEKKQFETVEVTAASYKVQDVDVYIDSVENTTNQTIDTTQSNLSALRQALLDNAKQEGEKLGTEMFSAMFGTAFETFNKLQNETAKKQGMTTEK